MPKPNRIVFDYLDLNDLLPSTVPSPADFNREYREGVYGVRHPVTQQLIAPAGELGHQSRRSFADALSEFISSVPVDTFKKDQQSDEQIKEWVLKHNGFRPISSMRHKLLEAYEKESSEKTDQILSFKFEKYYSEVGFDSAKKRFYSHAEALVCGTRESDQPISSKWSFGSIALVLRFQVELGVDEQGNFNTYFNLATASCAEEVSDVSPDLKINIRDVLSQAGYQQRSTEIDSNFKERDDWIVREEQFVEAHYAWYQHYVACDATLLLHEGLWTLNSLLKQYAGLKYRTDLSERLIQIAALQRVLNECFSKSNQALEQPLRDLLKATQDEERFLNDYQKWLAGNAIPVPRQNSNKSSKYYFYHYPLLQTLKLKIENYLSEKKGVRLYSHQELNAGMGYSTGVYQARIILNWINQVEALPARYNDYCFVLSKIIKMRDDMAATWFGRPRDSEDDLLGVLMGTLPFDSRLVKPVSSLSHAAAAVIQTATVRLLRDRQRERSYRLAKGLFFGTAVGLSVGVVLEAALYAVLGAGPAPLVIALLSSVGAGMACGAAPNALALTRKGYRLLSDEMDAEPTELGSDQSTPALAKANHELALSSLAAHSVVSQGSLGADVSSDFHTREPVSKMDLTS